MLPHAAAIIDVAAKYGVEARIIGRVEAAEKKELLITTANGPLQY
jgi:hypothetical protein